MVKPNGLCFGLVPFAPRVEGTKARVHLSPRKGCDTSHLTVPRESPAAVPLAPCTGSGGKSAVPEGDWLTPSKHQLQDEMNRVPAAAVSLQLRAAS